MIGSVCSLGSDLKMCRGKSSDSVVVLISTGI